MSITRIASYGNLAVKPEVGEEHELKKVHDWINFPKHSGKERTALQNQAARFAERCRRVCCYDEICEPCDLDEHCMRMPHGKTM